MLITHLQAPGRFFFRKPTVCACRYHIKANSPPLNTFSAFLTPVQTTWNALVPPAAKYFGAACTAGLALTKIHPSVLFTVGPPLALSAWLWRRQVASRRYRRELLMVMPATPGGFEDKGSCIEMKDYDETDERLIREGIETQFDYFKRQITELVTRRMRDYGSDGKALLLVDTNGQFRLHLSEHYVETFVLLRAEVSTEKGPEVVDFIKLSMPLFESRHHSTKRATVEVYLLQVPQTKNQYRSVLRISPYLMWPKERIVIGSLPGGLMTSQEAEPAADITI